MAYFGCLMARVFDGILAQGICYRAFVYMSDYDSKNAHILGALGD